MFEKIKKIKKDKGRDKENKKISEAIKLIRNSSFNCFLFIIDSQLI